MLLFLARKRRKMDKQKVGQTDRAKFICRRSINARWGDLEKKLHKQLRK